MDGNGRIRKLTITDLWNADWQKPRVNDLFGKARDLEYLEEIILEINRPRDNFRQVATLLKDYPELRDKITEVHVGRFLALQNREFSFLATLNNLRELSFDFAPYTPSTVSPRFAELKSLKVLVLRHWSGMQGTKDLIVAAFQKLLPDCRLVFSQ